MLYVSGARIFGKHALGNLGKSSGHGENSLLDTFGRVYCLVPARRGLQQTIDKLDNYLDKNFK